MPLMPMADVESDKANMLKNIGDVSNVEVFGANVLLAIYKRGEKTKSGIILSAQTRTEDKFQGKVGLVLKKGPLAFKADDKVDFGGVDVNVGDWVLFRVADGWPISLNSDEGNCRMILDQDIKGRVAQPDLVW